MTKTATLTPMTSADLQAARKRAAERFALIAASCVPEGWTVSYRKGLSGCCWQDRMHIEAPRPVTRKALYIFLHECAHAHLHAGSNAARHVKEHEAERWAHQTMRENGIPVPRAMTKRAKAYVARKIDKAQRSGAKRIDPKAKAFAKPS